LSILSGTTPSLTAFLRHHHLFTDAKYVISKVYLLTWIFTCAWRIGLEIIAHVKWKSGRGFLKYGENYTFIKRVGFYREKWYLWSWLLQKEAIKCYCLVSIAYLKQQKPGTIEIT